MKNEQMIKYNQYGWVDLSEIQKREKLFDWKNSVGCKIYFKYQNIESYLEILEYLGNSYIKICIPDYTGEYIINVGHVIEGKFGAALGRISYDFRYKVGDIIDNHLLIISAYKKGWRRCYEYMCLKDGYIGHASETSIQNGSRCAVCANKVVLVGCNDIATTRPDIAVLFLDQSDAFKYTEHSNKKVYFKCPRCGNIIYACINQVSKYGLSCRQCNDGISYPEKFLFNLLKQICNLHKDNIQLQNFEPQKTFEWSKNIAYSNPKLSGNKIYDFYIPFEAKILVETHGEFHFKDCLLNTRKNTKTLKEVQENDELKKNLALDNGIKKDHYVVLDCSNSDMNYIKKSIISSNLPQLLDFTEDQIDWSECNRFATSSRVYEACNLWNSGLHTTKDIMAEMKMSESATRSYLRRGYELGILQDPPEYLLKT